MCVILFSFLESDDRPLVLAANRDEFYDRPSAPAARWEDAPNVFAGRDLVANGTWLGVTDGGRFAAVTNFRDPSQPKGDLSRGALVSGFLLSEVSSSDYLEGIAAEGNRYTGFNLLVGEINDDRRSVHYLSNRGEGPRALPPGMYGLSNRFLDTPWPKVKRGKRKLGKLLRDKGADLDGLFGILSDRKLADDSELPDTGIGYEKEKLLSPIFIETPIYGTRNSSVLLFDGNNRFTFEERVHV